MSDSIRPATLRRKRSPSKSAAIKAKKTGQSMPRARLTAKPSNPARAASRSSAVVRSANAASRKRSDKVKRTKVPENPSHSASHRGTKKDRSSRKGPETAAHEQLTRSEEKFRSLIETAAGHGTTNRIYLPIADHDGRVAASRAPRASRAVGGETVLVVEDDQRVRRVSVRRLKELGYAIIEVDSGPAALKMLDQGDPIDLVFTDVVMLGEMTGLDLAREVRRRSPRAQGSLHVRLRRSRNDRGWHADCERRVARQTL